MIVASSRVNRRQLFVAAAPEILANLGVAA
jgi:hypothetical protein